MTFEGHALVRAILAAPDDDLPRLVYADWLEENGRPTLAELTRLQCAVADLRDRQRVPWAACDALAERRNAAHRSPEFERELGPAWVRWGYFYKGLVGTAEFRLASFAPEELEPLGHSYGLRRLEVSSVIDPVQLAAFLRWRVLSAIPHLSIRVWDTTGEATGPTLKVIAEHGWGNSPEQVAVEGLNFVGDIAMDGVRALARAVANGQPLRRFRFTPPGPSDGPAAAMFRQVIRASAGTRIR
jgi:uncharacterized protein (TIGR02996 family)